jgi:hypothetical protein
MPEPRPSGAVQETVTEPSPATTVGAEGVSGTVEGVTDELAVEAALAPAELLAVTVKVTAVPFARPDTVQVSSAVEQVAPLEATTTY